MHLGSNKQYLVSDFPAELITRSNLVEGVDYQDGYLLGSYVLGFKIKNGEVLYRLFKVDFSNNKPLLIKGEGYQLGYVDFASGEISQIVLTDHNGKKLYNRYMYKDGFIKDFGIEAGREIEWWFNKELQGIFNNNKLTTESGKDYGIQIINSIFTRYGDSYQVAISKANLVSPFLKYNLKFEYFQTFYGKFLGVPKPRKGKLSSVEWLNFFRISETTKLKANELLSKIKSLVSIQLATSRIPSVLPIDDIISDLNSFLKGDVAESGPNLEEIGLLLSDLLGSIDFNNPDNLLYKISYNAVRNIGNEFQVNNLIMKKQTEKDWYRAWYQIFDEYTYNGKSFESLIIASGIKSKDPFSGGQYFDDNDIELTNLIRNLIINIFGRFTFISMRMGSFFARDFNARIVSHPWQTIYTQARDTHISLLHNIIPQSPLSKMRARDNYYRAQNTLLDIYTLGITEKLPTGPDPKTDFIVKIIPGLPTEKWAPVYKDTTEIPIADLSRFYDFLSYITAKDLFSIPERQLKQFTSKVSGNMELYFTLIEIYQAFIDKSIENGKIDSSQKSTLMLMISEAVNSVIFSDKGATKNRRLLEGYLLSAGSDKSKWGDLTLRIPGFPKSLEYLKTVKLNFNLFSYFKYKDVNTMIGSLSTSINVKEYLTENILRAQRNSIINFGNFLKEIGTNLQEGHQIEIRPFTTYTDGFAYSDRATYLSFFPNAEDSSIEQVFLLDSSNVMTFGEKFIKILGGLLLDHQTFVLSEVDSHGNVVKYLCAFNLLSGALRLESKDGLNLYIPKPTTTDFISAPDVTAFDLALYDSSNPASILNIMNSFKEDKLLIGYHRVGDRRLEGRNFKEICESLSFIRDLFN
jgi:hypothetical protein